MLQMPKASADHVVVIGAGIGGLAAALALSTKGLSVTVLEAASQIGGKMRQIRVPGAARGIDAGPTVFTMKWVFDDLFAETDRPFDDAVTLQRADILARHAWPDGSTLDLFADVERSALAIAGFAGDAEADRFRRFCAHTEDIYQTLEGPFIRGSRPSMLSMSNRMGFAKWPALLRADPFSKMWDVLRKRFRDPRLRQLFGRYATYCGSSPFLCPATLMLVAHVERQGVWYVDGGMHALARAVADAAARNGAIIRTSCGVARIETANDGVSGVTLDTGEHVPARHVIFNGDVSALGGGLLGDAFKAVAEPVAPKDRSLSACTWTIAAKTAGFPLLHHNVFFSDPANHGYRAEFDDVLSRARTPENPTVYVCAQDRGDAAPTRLQDGRERLLILTNAPAIGDMPSWTARETRRCQQRTFAHLEALGLTVTAEPRDQVLTTPVEFASLFPGTGGALYGRANHSWNASFHRPDTRTRIRGLYLAGGSAHPGPGVPMAALSGRLAALSLHQDLTSTGRSRPVAISGGMSTG